MRGERRVENDGRALRVSLDGRRRSGTERRGHAAGQQAAARR